MVDVAHIVLRKSVRNFIFGEFCKEISPTLQKPAGVRGPRQAEYNFHNDFSLCFYLTKYKSTPDSIFFILIQDVGIIVEDETGICPNNPIIAHSVKRLSLGTYAFLGS